MKIKQLIEKYKIKEIMSDIKTDIEINRQREDKAENDYVRPKYDIPLPYVKRGENTGIFPIVAPHVAGMIIGAALAKAVHGGVLIYLIFSIVFAFAMGIWKSIEIDKIELKYAIVRNLLIMLRITGIVLLAVILVIVTWQIGG